MTRVYNLVQRENEKILIAANIFLGRKKSLHEGLMDIIMLEEPDILILIDLIDLHHSSLDPMDIYRLVKTVDKIRPRVRIVYGCAELSPEQYRYGDIDGYGNRELKEHVLQKLEEVVDRLSSQVPDDITIDENSYLAALMKLRLIYKYSGSGELRIRLANGEELFITSGDKLYKEFSRELYGAKTPSMKRILQAIELMRKETNADWIIAGHPGVAKIHEEKRIAFPGSWHTYSEYILFSGYVKPSDLEKFLLITGDGVFKIDGIPYQPCVSRRGHG